MFSYLQNQSIAATEYTFTTAVSNQISIVQLTDLHNAEFGEGNCELVDLVGEQSPDIIVMTGDMINRDDEDLSVVRSLISDLSEIAPVYYGYGNHEADWEDMWQSDLKSELTDAGAVVLNNDFTDITVNGASLRIGGYMGYYRQPGMLTKDESQKEAELAFADDFEDTDRFKILLNHIPTQWVDWGYIDKFPVDIVFSGHYHGGVMRIPVIDRGVYAPYVGWFPPYTKGVFTGDKATCVLSAGLGSEHIVPRLNNPPEIVAVDLVPISN
ncbi:MAG: metallophosphoesterase [Eubacterium sp.]